MFTAGGSKVAFLLLILFPKIRKRLWRRIKRGKTGGATESSRCKTTIAAAQNSAEQLARHIVYH